MTVVVDADVLIGALDATDAHHDEARRRFRDWHVRGTARLVSVINLSEVLIGPSSEAELLRRARLAIAALGTDAHVPNEAIAVDAARLRGRHPISLPDAYLLGTARHLDAGLVSFDQQVLRAARAERLRLA